jgi:hypothetical protein
MTADWGESRELVEWWSAEHGRLPRSPFKLWPWTLVSDPNRFFASLAVDVAAGPDGPRARRDVLQEDLARLRNLFGSQKGTG